LKLCVVFLGFLKYLHTILKTSNYNKVFFVSRDGFYLKIIYDLLRKEEESLPESSYFLSSRVLSYSASIIDKKSITYIANKDYFPTTLRHLLKVRFNFTDEMFQETQGSLKQFGFSSFDDDVVQHINHDNYVDFVLSYEKLIIKENKKNKQIFSSYIKSTNIDENSLIVDIGYAGSLQETLLTITGKKIDGLYFVVNEKIEQLKNNGLKYFSYISHQNNISSKFFQYVQLFELLFSATHPSVIGLNETENGFKPIYDPTNFSEKTNKVLSQIHKGSVSFVSEYLNKHKDKFLEFEEYNNEKILHNIFRFFENPDRLDCELFDEVIFEDNFGANKYSLITKDIEKLELEDNVLLSHGIWASASRKLINNTSSLSIQSSNKYIDELKSDMKIKPFYKNKDYLEQSSTTKYPFFNIILNIDEENVNTILTSINNQYYPYYCVVCCFNNDISNETKELLIYNKNTTYIIGEYKTTTLNENEWVLFADNSITFEPNLLIETYNYIMNNNVEIVYFDEDDLINGEYKNSKFKPDISPELMLSQPYYCGSLLFAKAKFLSNQSSVDYVIPETIFNALIKNVKIGHIPKILFHNIEIKPFTNYKKIIEQYLNTKKIDFEGVIEEEYSKKLSQPVYSVEFPNEGPEIAILIPTKNKYDVLKVCLDSLEMTSYKNYKVYIINNDSDEDDILEYFENTKHKVLTISSQNGVFSYSYINNEAAKLADEDYVLFLNNDVKVLTPNWLSQMVGLIQIDGIGQVGARLYYENDMLQHVGITNNIASYGLPAPSFKLIDGDSSGYLNYAKSIKNFSAVTAACMLTKKEVFFAMGGFDDNDFSVAYNDCDYGFKLTQNGYRNVVAPNAELYHYEGVTRGIGIGNDKPSEESSFIRKYKNWKDPYYNQNLTINSTDFSVRNTIVRTLPNQKFKCLMVSHNFEYEGAPLIQFEVAKGLKQTHNMDIAVLSPMDGPLREAYEKCGIETYTLNEFNLFNSNTPLDYENNLLNIKKQVKLINADIVCANTILSYWAIEIAHELNTPSLWIIHESEPPFEHLRDHSKLIESKGKVCINYPYKNIFVAHSTKELFESFNLKNNFEVIHNGFDTSRVTISLNESTRKSMRIKLDIIDKFVFICPGIISKRKSQMDAIKAFELLPSEIKSQIVILIVGDRKSPYSDEMHEYLNQSDSITQSNIKIIKETKEIGDFYNASDAFLFTSHLESFPKVIQEAMYLKLPIVSTNTFGIKEQVFHNSSALLCDIGDIKTLSQNMQEVFKDEALREKLVNNALSALDKLPTYDEMVKEYNEIMQQAYLIKVN